MGARAQLITVTKILTISIEDIYTLECGTNHKLTQNWNMIVKRIALKHTAHQ